jgi:hypothetical protein
MPNKLLAHLPEKDQRGSRARCLLLTYGKRDRIARRLSLIGGYPDFRIQPTDRWMPAGPEAPEEAKLGKSHEFLTDAQREALMSWWLVKRRGANVPNWDFASTATIKGKPGLLLVEAKAHEDETFPDGKSQGDPSNHARIGQAIAAAKAGLNAILPGWGLSRDNHYQIANRIAWAWKLADMGVPVMLVFLGFLKATEMGKPFLSDEQWVRHLERHCEGIVPRAAWMKWLDIHGTPFRLDINSADITLRVGAEDD